MRTSATLGGVPALAAFVVLVGLGGPLLGLIYGQSFRVAVPVLVILCLGQAVTVWAGSCGSALVMTGHERENLWILALSTSIMLAGALFFGRLYGGLGIAAAVALSMTVRNLMLLLRVRQLLGVWTHARLSPSAVAASLRSLRSG